MEISEFIENIKDDKKLNSCLQIVAAILVDKDEVLLDALNSAIYKPDRIENTNMFASILVELDHDEFIDALLEKVEVAELGKDKWIADYLYALGELLESSDDYFVPNDSLIHKLGNWLLSTGGGEISWKSGIILSSFNTELVLPYLLAGARNTDLFHLARISCMRGVINNFRSHAQSLIEELVGSECKDVSQAASDASKWLKSHNNSSHSAN